MLYPNQINSIISKIEIPVYSKDDLKYNNKEWKWEDKDFPRIPALLSFGRMINELNISSEKMLTFNAPSDPELEYIKTGIRHNFNYKDDREKNDLHSFDFKDKDYDFVMINQTIEHLYNPYIVVKNIYKHMRIDGYLYINAPCNNIPHEEPNHFYTGFTSAGLGAIVLESGFEIIRIGQWGNFDYLTKLFKEGWADYKICSWNNEKSCPIICWVLAKKLI
jgi:SAM-dependent methyltransferase